MLPILKIAASALLTSAVIAVAHADGVTGNGDRPFQLVLSLSFGGDTAAGATFNALANDEIKQVLTGKIFEDELRGL